MISKMRLKLVSFHTHLRQEENLQKLYQSKEQERQENQEMSEFDDLPIQDENMLDSELDYQSELELSQQFAPMMNP